MDPAIYESNLYKLGKLGDCAVLTSFINDFLVEFDTEVRLSFRGDYYQVEILSKGEIPNPSAVAELLFAGLRRLGIRHYDHLHFAAKDRDTTHTYWTDEYLFNEETSSWDSVKPRPGLVERLRRVLRRGPSLRSG